VRHGTTDVIQPIKNEPDDTELVTSSDNGTQEQAPVAIMCRFDAAVGEAIKHIAKEKGWSLSRFVNSVMTSYLQTLSPSHEVKRERVRVLKTRVNALKDCTEEIARAPFSCEIVEIIEAIAESLESIIEPSTFGAVLGRRASDRAFLHAVPYRNGTEDRHT